MSNAADGYLGDWLPHKDKCRCIDCDLERNQKRITRLEAENAQLKAQVSTLSKALSSTDIARQKFLEERDALRSQVAALSKPVSDEEWIEHRAIPSYANPPGTMYRHEINDLIAARLAAAQKEHAALNYHPQPLNPKG